MKSKEVTMAAHVTQMKTQEVLKDLGSEKSWKEAIRMAKKDVGL